MQFGTETIESNVNTLPWEQRALIGSSFPQIYISYVSIIDGCNDEKTWSPSVLNQYFHYLKDFGQMYYIIGCQYTYFAYFVSENSSVIGCKASVKATFVSLD